MTKREADFSALTIEVLAKRARQICSNPDCHVPTCGAHSENDKAISVGVAAHVHAAKPGGKRFDPTMTREERKHIDNAIWLCATCAKLIDTDETRFTVELLTTWKRKHEQLYSASLDITTNTLEGHLLPLPIEIPAHLSNDEELKVAIESDSNGLPVYSHISTSSSNPIALIFKVSHLAPEPIEHMLVHTWLPFGHIYRDPETRDSSIWIPQETENLPDELLPFGFFDSYQRFTLGLTPRQHFCLIPSRYLTDLPELVIRCKSFIGMIPIPWQIEAPKRKAISGVLLLWVSETGIFETEMAKLDVDWETIQRRLKSIIDKYKPDRSEMQFTGLPDY